MDTKKMTGLTQLFLRLSLGPGFILPVMDRLGWLGAPGSGKVAWGSWDAFVSYTNTLLPFLNRPLAGTMALLATIAEAVFGVCLILGFKTSRIALGGTLLTLSFAICMAVFVGIGAPFNYPVFVFSAACLALSGMKEFKWSIDYYLSEKRTGV